MGGMKNTRAIFENGQVRLLEPVDIAGPVEGVLVLPDPVYTCVTNAMGLPMWHRDVKRFPKQEQLISDFFDRTVFPYQVFL